MRNQNHKKYSLEYFARIDFLIDGTVEECRIAISGQKDLEFLNDVRSQIISEGGNRARLKVIDARIAQLQENQKGIIYLTTETEL